MTRPVANKLPRTGVTRFLLRAFFTACCMHASFAGADDTQSVEVLGHFPAEEAHQGVAVDAQYVYAIGSRTVAKYDKETGRRIARWEADEQRPLEHLNSGFVHRGKLYCAHSNYPHQPATSSIEIWDTATLEHVGNHSFGIYEGSCTWAVLHNDAWWVAFAHYNDKNDPQDTNNRRTTLVKFDQEWRRLAAWTFPDELMARLHPYSTSGGTWSPEGQLYITGHDPPTLFVLQLPPAGSTLELIAEINGSTPGQGIAWDYAADRVMYGVNRKGHEVVWMRVPDEIAF